jgi:hypothetical protein
MEHSEADTAHESKPGTPLPRKNWKAGIPSLPACSSISAIRNSRCTVVAEPAPKVLLDISRPSRRPAATSQTLLKRHHRPPVGLMGLCQPISEEELFTPAHDLQRPIVAGLDTAIVTKANGNARQLFQSAIGIDDLHAQLITRSRWMPVEQIRRPARHASHLKERFLDRAFPASRSPH